MQTEPKARRFNALLWGGLVLAVVALFTYFSVFVRFPITRDVPWVTYALLAIAAVLLVMGWARAPRKILASIVALLGFFLIGAFTFMTTMGTKSLPASTAAPSVGDKAPEFTLPDTNNRPVALSNALQGANGVLLIFYRGYW